MALADETPHKTEFDLTIEYLGGKKLFRPTNPVDVHRAIARGLPASTFQAMLLSFPNQEDVEKGTGVSKRTYQQRKKASKHLTPAQSDRVWRFASILATATAVLGTRDIALQWLKEPAMALDNERPIDLIHTQAGAQLVEDHLRRLDYGVYT